MMNLGDMGDRDRIAGVRQASKQASMAFDLRDGN